MAAVAPVLFPEMKARGAKEGNLVALVVGLAVVIAVPWISIGFL